jgi:hypothetical protein
MRGSPSAPLVAVRDRLNDWTPRLFPRGKSLNRKSSVPYRAGYMVDGTLKVAIENDSINVRAWGRLAMQDSFFPVRERISDKNSDLRSQANGDSGRDGVKGQDERQRTAPLTPSRPQREIARLLS